MLPEESIAMPWGVFSCARVARPPSPENPALEFPATTVNAPLGLTLKTAWDALKYRLPAESVATRLGCPMAAAVAATGVAGGAPPATVEIVYCCARASDAPATSRKIFTM